jgi:hypothetical protein
MGPNGTADHTAGCCRPTPQVSATGRCGQSGGSAISVVWDLIEFYSETVSVEPYDAANQLGKRRKRLGSQASILASVRNIRTSCLRNHEPHWKRFLPCRSQMSKKEFPAATIRSPSAKGILIDTNAVLFPQVVIPTTHNQFAIVADRRDGPSWV